MGSKPHEREGDLCGIQECEIQHKVSKVNVYSSVATIYHQRFLLLQESSIPSSGKNAVNLATKNKPHLFVT